MKIDNFLIKILGNKKDLLAQKTGKVKNSLVFNIRKILSEQNKHPKWPKTVINFQGVKDFTPLETYRNELLLPKEDPLA